MRELVTEAVQKDLGFNIIMQRITTYSPMGRDKKNEILPFLPGEEKELEKELEKVYTCFDTIEKKPEAFRKIQNLLAHVKDIRGSIKRSSKGRVLDHVELFEIKSFLLVIKDLEIVMREVDLDIEIKPIEEIEKLLDPDGKKRKSFFIENSYSKRLEWIRNKKRELEKELRQKKKELVKKIEEQFECTVNSKNEIIVNKGHSKLIKSMQESSEVAYIKENFASVIFVPRPSNDILAMEEKLEKLKLKEKEEEYQVRKMLSSRISKHFDTFMENARNIAEIDLLFGKGQLARDFNCVRPIIAKEPIIRVKNGRHPILEEVLYEKNLEYTPVDIILDKSVTIITGVNMGGKTASLKMIGLLACMAQYGFMIPAEEMVISLRNFIFFSLSYGESFADGLSAFGAEIRSIGNILDDKDNSGLILIDELARGTNPPEGIAIARSLIETFLKSNSFTLITTHFHQLSEIEGLKHLQVKGFKNYDISLLKDKIDQKGDIGVEMLNELMDYKLVQVEEDASPPRDTLKVARLMGIDESIVFKAEKYLKQKNGRKE